MPRHRRRSEVQMRRQRPVVRTRDTQRRLGGRRPRTRCAGQEIDGNDSIAQAEPLLRALPIDPVTPVDEPPRTSRPNDMLWLEPTAPERRVVTTCSYTPCDG